MPRRILFDATRLLQRVDRASPTGIDRVAGAYARWLASLPEFEVQPVAVVAGRLCPVSQKRLPWPPPAPSQAGPDGGAFAALLDRLSGPAGGGEGLRPPPQDRKAQDRETLKLLSDVFLAALVKAPPRGDLYLNVSHSGLEQPDFLKGLREAGMTNVVMLHDLIPLTYPEYCGPGAEARHELRVRAALEHAGLILTNSAATAADLAAYAAARGLKSPPVCAAPLGVEPAFAAPQPPPESPQRPLAPYFLYVGTIEARKNLAFLLTLWRRLAEEEGGAAPRLVLVGRRGWENEAVIDHLERSPSVRSLVHEVCDLTDAQLVMLMSGARALIGPSLAEGFDLPVMEALALGARVIASDIPVHRELAPDAVLVDPLDGPGWLAAIRTAMTAPPAAPRPGPTWDGHFATVAAALEQLAW